MGAVLEKITPELQVFITAQPLFFVATAPLGAGGHVNLSPKGLDTFRVLSPTRVAYLDLTGSGNETAAHLLENARITFMFCAFDGPPRIVRLYGRGRSIQPTHAEWTDVATHFTLCLGIRQIIVADIVRVQTSCGYGVPVMLLQGNRDIWFRWAEQKGEAGIRDYQIAKNACSIDDLPTPLTGIGSVSGVD